MSSSAGKCPESSRIVMYETILPQHCDNSSELNTGELLRWADLATCASAEAHTGTNCVTVAVSDLAFEEGVVPCVGELLEIVATPVLVNNTSLVIALLVTVESRGLSTRRAACSATFTYVTMRTAEGVRPKCPPLVLSTDEARYTAILAKERKSLLAKNKAAIESELASPRATPDQPVDEGAVAMSRTTVRMTELVLPEHTNHMNATFGGQVMAWMHKAAMVSAGRHVSMQSSTPKVLRVSAVEAVDFPAPSKASDHLLFEAVVCRVFQPNRLAISVLVQKRVLSDNSSITTINTGVFHISAWEGGSHAVTTPALVIPVMPDQDDVESKATFQKMRVFQQMTEARAAMLSFRGGALPWVDLLAEEASRTTIEAVLRLSPAEGGPEWEELWSDSDATGVSAHVAKEVWGQDQTAVKFSMNCPNTSAGEVCQLLLDFDKRSAWDELCVDFTLDEQLSDNSDLMRLTLRIPLEIAGGCQPALGFAKLLSGCVPAPQTEFSLLRTSRQEGSYLYIVAYRSVVHPRYQDVIGSGRRGVTMPSGWVVSASGQGCNVKYVVQMQNEQVRKLLGTVDNIGSLARIHCQSLARLRAMTKSPDQSSR